MRAKTSKLTLIALSISVSFSMIIAAYLPLRARTDEANVVRDIYTALNTGHLYDPSYASGPGYATWITTILKISGLQYLATEWLSPLLGGIGLIMMGTFLLQTLRQTHKVSMSGSAAVFATPFLFAGFVGRIRETSHKLLTFTLVFMLLYTIFNMLQRRKKRQFRWVFFLAITTLSFLNFFWITIYGTLLTVALVLAQNYQGQRPNYALVLIPPIFGILMAIWSTLTSFRVGSLVRKFFLAIIVSTKSDTPTVSGRASAWPKIDIATIEVSLGIVFSVGIMIAGVLTAFAIVHIAFRYLNGKQFQPLAVLSFSVSILSGGLFVGLLASGGLPTAKRIIFLPGVLGVLYWIDTLTRHQGATVSRTSEKYKTAALGCLCLVMLIGSLMGIPRIMMDGELNPNKFYADDSDIERVEWAGKHAKVGDCVTHQKLDRVVSEEFRLDVAVNESVNHPTQVVYSGGGGLDNAISCPMTVSKVDVG